MPDLTVALAGNPNAGKTTLFNALTGSRQHVGNWPGKTVERKHGLWRVNGADVDVIDLPGTYSLSAYTSEESITRDYLVETPPDVLVVVVDAAHLERNLYLVVQLLELGLNTILALNMSDIADTKGMTIDSGALSARLGGLPVVRVVASKGEGLEALCAQVLQIHTGEDASERQGQPLPRTIRAAQWSMDYGPELEDAIWELRRVIEGQAGVVRVFNPRWLAIKLLEGDAELTTRLAKLEGGNAVLDALRDCRASLQPGLTGGAQVAFADKRYGFVGVAVSEALSRPEDRPSLSERLDRVVTSPTMGVPLFLFVMYVVFNLVVNVSAPYLDWIDATISGPLTSWARELLLLLSAPAWLQGLLLDGVIAGVGGVLVFVPGLIALFLFIAVLEDSGYLARAAFVMHRIMGRIGLSGKSFVALILGFGCAVPAIYATRTLDSFRERVLTGLLVPLMSCAARLPVYVVFGIAFFGREADIVIWGLYALGILVATLSAWLFSNTILKKDEGGATLLIELPSYRIPSPRTLWRYVAQRTMGFLQNAGTVILGASVVIWLLLSLPLGVDNLRQSWFGKLGAVIAPALAPAGFGTWETSGSLVSGLVAKEVVVSTMSQIYVGNDPGQGVEPIGLGEGLREIGGGFLIATKDAGIAIADLATPFIPLKDASEQPVDTELGSALQTVFTPLSALAFLVFVLLYVPCIATLGTIRSEFGTRWAIFSAIYQTGIAWLMAVGVYQIGALLGRA